MAEVNEKVILSVQLDYKDSVKKSADLAAEIKKLTDANKALKKEGKETTEQYIENARGVDALKKQQSSLNKIITSSILEQKELAGSLNQMQAQVVALTAKYYQLSDAERDNAEIGGVLENQIRELNDSLKASDATVGVHTRNVGNYADALKNLRAELKDLKGQLSTLDEGSEEYIKAAEKAGKLSDKIKEVNENSNAMAAGSNFEKLGNTFDLLKSDLANLDFEGAKAKAQAFSDISKQMTFTEMKTGMKDLTTSLGTMGKAILSNPLFILAAVVVAVGLAMKEYADSVEQRSVAATERLTASIKANIEFQQEMIDVSKENSDLQLKLLQAQKASEEEQYKARLAALRNEKKLRIQLQIELGDSLFKLEKELATAKNDEQIKSLKEQIKSTIQIQQENAKLIKSAKTEELILEANHQEELRQIRNSNALAAAETAVLNAKRTGKGVLAAEIELAREQREVALSEANITNEQRLKIEAEYNTRVFELRQAFYDEFVKKQMEADAKRIADEKAKEAATLKAREDAYNSANVLLKRTFTDAEILRNEELQKGLITEQEFNDQQLLAKQTQLEAQIALDQEYYKTTVDNELALAQTRTQIAQKEADDKAAINAARIAQEEQTVVAFGNLAAGMAALAGENTAAAKAAATAQALISTYFTAQKAYESAFLPVPTIASPALGVISAAAAVAVGLGNLKRIAGIGVGGAAAGGGDFMTKGPTLLLVGDNPGGVEKISVTPVSGRGKTSVAPGGNLVAMAGGGSITTGFGGYAERRGFNPAIIDYDRMANTLKELPAPILSLTQLDDAQIEFASVTGDSGF